MHSVCYCCHDSCILPLQSTYCMLHGHLCDKTTKLACYSVSSGLWCGEVQSSSCGHERQSIKGIIKASAHCQALIWLGDGGALGLVASSESNLKPVQTPNSRQNRVETCACGSDELVSLPTCFVFLICCN